MESDFYEIISHPYKTALLPLKCYFGLKVLLLLTEKERHGSKQTVYYCPGINDSSVSFPPIKGTIDSVGCWGWGRLRRVIWGAL